MLQNSFEKGKPAERWGRKATGVNAGLFLTESPVEN
jgi:hypothetical protein